MLRERAFVKYKPTELFSGEAQRKSGFCQTKGQAENCFSRLPQVNLDENETFDTRILISNYAFTHLAFNLISFFIQKTYFILNKFQLHCKKDTPEVLCKSMQISRIGFKNKISHNYRKIFRMMYAWFVMKWHHISYFIIINSVVIKALALRFIR